MESPMNQVLDEVIQRLKRITKILEETRGKKATLIKPSFKTEDQNDPDDERKIFF